MTAQVGDIWYRYDHFAVEGGDAVVSLSEHPVTKVTARGAWVCGKFVNFSWRKRFAYPTKEEAMDSFLRRKRSQIALLDAQLKSARAALQRAESGNFGSMEVSFEPFGEGLL